MGVKNFDGDDKVFLAACEIAKVRATRRQYAKYSRQGRGKAYSVREEARKQVHGDK